MSQLPLFVSPGRHLVARINDLLVFAEGDDAHLRQLTTELTDLLPEAMWTGLLRFLASKISTVGFDNHPPIACVEVLESSVNVFVFGDISVAVETTAESEVVTGAGMTTWREVSLTGQTTSIVGGQPEYSTGIVGMLARGLVAGGGFTMAPDWPVSTSSSGSMLNAISGATTVAASTPPAPEPEIAQDPELHDPVTHDPVVEELAGSDVLLADEVDVEDVASLGAMEEPFVAPEAPIQDPTPPAVDETSAPEIRDEPEAPAVEAQPPAPHEYDTITSMDDGPLATPENLANTMSLPSPIVTGPEASTAPPVDEVEVEVEVEVEEVDEGFDPHATTAFTGAALSDAVRAARAAPPDPRRVSGPEGEGGDPLPPAQELRGVLCPNGHLSSMQDPVCRTCSERVNTEGQIVAGPRPILGVIEFDDGVRIPLDRPVVIGRQPPEDYRINGEHAYVVPITDEEGLISRVHVEVHLIGWDVELIDKNSVNGTFTSTSTESTSRTRLRAEHPTQIELGTIVYVGDRVFRLNTGHVVD